MAYISPPRAVRRSAQTVTSFDDGLRTLLDLARGRPELTFHTKLGPVMTIPNVAGARVPIYEVFAEDAYRFDELLDGLPDDLVVLDIGAHVGSFSISVAARRPGARVHSFEASPTTAGFLTRNVGANHLAGRVSVHNTAVSDHEGRLTFMDNESGSGENGLTQKAGRGRRIEVECTTFGRAAQDAAKAAGAPVSLVKIDTEGAEYAIVGASSPDDWADVQRVVMEHHDVPGHRVSELTDFFAEAGLDVSHHEPGGDNHGVLWLTRTRSAGAAGDPTG